MGNFWGNSVSLKQLSSWESSKIELKKSTFQFVKLYKRYKDYKLSVDPHHVPRKISLIGQISLYLIPGVFVFIFAPAMLFSFFEDWDYSTSVYYTFVVSFKIGNATFFVM
jgi:hypothetical protein